jgi:hypothetical protein
MLILERNAVCCIDNYQLKLNRTWGLHDQVHARESGNITPLQLVTASLHMPPHGHEQPTSARKEIPYINIKECSAASMGRTPPPLNGIQVPDWKCYPPVNREKASTMNKLGRVDIVLAKNVFQLHGVDRYGKAVWRRRLTRDKWLDGLLEKN